MPASKHKNATDGIILHAAMAGFGERIKIAADRVGGLDSLAERIPEMSRRSLSDYVSEKTDPRASLVRTIAFVTGVDAGWLLVGDDDELDQAPAMGDPSDLEQPGMISIPRYDEVRPSAGPGAVAVSEIPTTRVAFERHWLLDIGVQPDAAVILPAQGDSMSPTIPNGAPMLVDTSKTEVRSGYIYVIAVEDDLLVKRVKRRLDGLFDLISDNTAYKTETLDPLRLTQLRVIGRVYAAVSKF